MAAPAKNGNGNFYAAAFAVVTALINAFWGVAWGGVNASLDRIERQAAARAQTIEEQFLRLREHQAFALRLDSQISKMEVRLTEAATRGELDTRLGINSASIIQVRQDIDVLKRDLGQTYPLKDALGNIQGRLDRIEQWSRAPPPSSKP